MFVSAVRFALVLLLFGTTPLAFCDEPKSEGADKAFTWDKYFPSRKLIGKPAPEIELEHVQGFDNDSLTSLRDLRGKYVLIDFWYKSCGPCIAQFEKLNEIQHELRSKLVVLAITPDTPESAVDLLERVPLKTLIGYDTDKSVITDYNVIAWPTLVVIDPTGKVIAVPLSPGLDLNSMRSVVEGKGYPKSKYNPD